MAEAVNLTGHWVGHYLQQDQPHGIAANLAQTGRELTGGMRDLETEFEHSVFEMALAAGLEPGADEQIVARLREMYPGLPAGRVRHLMTLPPTSELRGHVADDVVYFLKVYQGTHFVGYRVGEERVGVEIPAHAVHYQGRLSPDGLEIEGTWWIPPNPEHDIIRTEGFFILRRRGGGTETGVRAARSASQIQKRPGEAR